MTPSPITVFQHHLSDEVRVFRYDAQPAADTASAVVVDSVVSEPEPTYCRVYLFLDRWLQVFVTFDEQLRLKGDPYNAFPYAFNCDMTTPHYRVGNHLYTTDVCLDVVVQPDGQTYTVEDRDELEEAYAQGLFGTQWYEETKREGDALVRLIQEGRFLSFLESIAPFPSEWQDHAPPTLTRVPLNQTEFQYHPEYPRFK